MKVLQSQQLTWLPFFGIYIAFCSEKNLLYG